MHVSSDETGRLANAYESNQHHHRIDLHNIVIVTIIVCMVVVGAVPWIDTIPTEVVVGGCTLDRHHAYGA